jgi:hypothetical protein
MAGWDYVDFSRQQKKLTVTNPASFTGHTAAKSRMIELGNRSFLAPYVELNYANFFISPETSPAEKLIFSKRVLRFSPIPEAQIRHSLYLFENGEVAQSVEYFAKCASLYPEVSQRFIAELSLHPMGYEKWLDLVKGK